MFKQLFSACVLCLLCTLASAQNSNRFGIRAGVSTTDINADDLLITDNAAMQQLRIGIQEAGYGYHFGVFGQLRGKRFFLQPEILFNSNSVDFRVTDLATSQSVPEILNERYQYLDIPINAGLRVGKILRLQGGLVGHIFINNVSELTQIENYEERFDEFTYGWQAGLGLDLSIFALDLKYEGNFENFGSHIIVDGQEYQFDQSPTRLVASLGVTF